MAKTTDRVDRDIWREKEMLAGIERGELAKDLPRFLCPRCRRKALKRHWRPRANQAPVEEQPHRVRFMLSERHAALVLSVLAKVEKLAAQPEKSPRRKLEQIHQLMPRLAQLVLEPVQNDILDPSVKRRGGGEG